MLIYFTRTTNRISHNENVVTLYTSKTRDTIYYNM